MLLPFFQVIVPLANMDEPVKHGGPRRGTGPRRKLKTPQKKVAKKESMTSYKGRLRYKWLKIRKKLRAESQASGPNSAEYRALYEKYVEVCSHLCLRPTLPDPGSSSSEDDEPNLLQVINKFKK
jgi:hypothetical protein